MPIAARLRAVFMRVQESAHAARLRLFAGSTRANVAMIFALSLVPLTIGAGAGLDLARAMVVRDQLSEALDAAGLAIAGTPGLTQAQMQTMAQQYFNANYKADSSYGTPVLSPPAVSGPVRHGQRFGLDADHIAERSRLQHAADQRILDRGVGPAKTLGVAGARQYGLDDPDRQFGPQQDHGAQIRHAPVADNVAERVEHGRRRGRSPSCPSPATSRSARLFERDLAGLDQLERHATPPTPSTSVGPGSNCPWSDNSQGYHCSSDPANGGADTNTIPSSGTYKGLYLPVRQCGRLLLQRLLQQRQLERALQHTWVSNAKSTWSGCVTDRTQNYDSQNTTPTSTAATLFPADNSPSCPVTALLALGYNWTTLSNEVDAMVANGSTNQTIGLAWGWQALSQGSPLSAPTLPANTQQVIIPLERRLEYAGPAGTATA